MFQQTTTTRPRRSRLRAAAVWMTVVCMVMSIMIVPGAAIAGKEGVFINDSAYFSLEEVTLSSGTDNQTMRYTVQLNNNGDSQIDYNRYGVRVTSADGASYYAQLSQKGAGLVAPNSTAKYYYVSKISSSVAADQLYVTVFERVGNETRDLGSLSVASSTSLRQNAHQLLVNMADIDTAQTNQAFVSFQPLKAYAAPKDGKWTFAIDVAAQPTGTESVALPSGLKFALRDTAGKLYAMNVKAADGSTLASGQNSHLLLTATLDNAPSVKDYTLELSKNEIGSNVFGKLSLSSVAGLAKAGDRVEYSPNGQQGLSLELKGVELSQQGDKRDAMITVLFHNESGHTVQVPSLAGSAISAENTLTVDATAVSTPDPYVASGEAAIFRFGVALPDGISAESMQLLLAQKASSSSGASSSSSQTASGSSTSGTTASTGSGSATSGSSSSASGDTLTGNIPVFAAALTGAVATANPSGSTTQLPVYQMNSRMVFDSASKLIDSNLEVSMVEINAHTNEDNGYQTVVAKFKFLNKSSETLSLPTFDTELKDGNGTAYPGARQTTSLTQLIPNAAYVYSYTYLLPPTSKGNYTLRILDSSASSKFKVAIAAYEVVVNSTGDETPTMPERTLSLYPFSINVEAWEIGQQYSSNAYTYRLKLSLDIKKEEQVIVDDTFSTVLFEVVDSRGRVLGSTTAPLQGTDRLFSGQQTITFSNIKSEQFDYPLTIRMYESIKTQSGSTTNRLLATFSQ